MQAVFRLSDTVVSSFLHFFVVFCTILGRFYKIGKEIAQCLPHSIYKAKKLVDDVKFCRYVVCRKCHSVYSFKNCLDGLSTNGKSKSCCFQHFPAHPHRNMRKPCETLLNHKACEWVFLSLSFFNILLFEFRSVITAKTKSF